MSILRKIKHMQQEGAPPVEVARAIIANKRRNSFFKWAGIGVLAVALLGGAALAGIHSRHMRERASRQETTLLPLLATTPQAPGALPESTLWSMKLNGSIDTVFLVDKVLNVLFNPVGSTQERNPPRQLLTYDPKTKSKLSSSPAGVYTPSVMRELTQVVYKDMIITAGYELKAIRAEEIVWQYRLESGSHTFIDLSSRSLFYPSGEIKKDYFNKQTEFSYYPGSNYVFYQVSTPGSDNTIECIHLENGRPFWTYHPDSHGFGWRPQYEAAAMRLHVIGQEVFVGFEDSPLFIVLDLAAGKEKFKVSLGDAGAYLAGADEHAIYLFNRDTIAAFKRPNITQ